MADSPVQTEQVVVVGAGIVGACTALWLLRDGRRVVLMDRGEPGQGTSFGNAAIVSEESVIPVATPGILWKIPGMIADPLGPLAVRWSYLPRLLPWLGSFLAAGRAKRVEEISIALAALLDGTLATYAELLQIAGAPDLIRRSGLVCVYENEAGYRDHKPMLEVQRRRGRSFDLLGPAELYQLEPSLARIFKRAVFYSDVGHALDPLRLVRKLVGSFQEQGGDLRRAEARGFEIGPEGPRAVVTETGRVPCAGLVIAAGAWSKPLAAQLGSRPPLDTERGYHVQFPNPGVMPRLPIYSTEHALAATPLEVGLRFAGTVELGGLRAPPNWARAQVLHEHARRWFPNLGTEGYTRWMGYRPSMPDSLPVIGRSPNFANTIFAFGHGHLGLMLGAKTGRLAADLIGGRDPGIDMRPYRVERF